MIKIKPQEAHGIIEGCLAQIQAKGAGFNAGDVGFLETVAKYKRQGKQPNEKQLLRLDATRNRIAKALNPDNHQPAGVRLPEVGFATQTRQLLRDKPVHKRGGLVDQRNWLLADGVTKL